MLWVANAAQPHLGLSPPPTLALPLGAVLGVLAIPLYALGYRAISQVLAAGSLLRARVVMVCGLAGSLLGAFIHGWTAIAIHETIASGEAAESFDSILASGGILSVAWGLASLLILAASIAMTAPRALRVAGLPRELATVSPAVATFVLALTGLPWELGRALWLPAAPNLAHAVCFGAWLAVLGRSAGSTALRDR